MLITNNLPQSSKERYLYTSHTSQLQFCTWTLLLFGTQAPKEKVNEHYSGLDKLGETNLPGEAHFFSILCLAYRTEGGIQGETNISVL